MGNFFDAFPTFQLNVKLFQPEEVILRGTNTYKTLRLYKLRFCYLKKSCGPKEQLAGWVPEVFSKHFRHWPKIWHILSLLSEVLCTFCGSKQETNIILNILNRRGHLQVYQNNVKTLNVVISLFFFIHQGLIHFCAPEMAILFQFCSNYFALQYLGFCDINSVLMMG